MDDKSILSDTIISSLLICLCSAALLLIVNIGLVDACYSFFD